MQTCIAIIRPRFGNPGELSRSLLLAGLLGAYRLSASETSMEIRDFCRGRWSSRGLGVSLSLGGSHVGASLSFFATPPSLLFQCFFAMCIEETMQFAFNAPESRGSLSYVASAVSRANLSVFLAPRIFRIPAPRFGPSPPGIAVSFPVPVPEFLDYCFRFRLCVGGIVVILGFIGARICLRFRCS